MFPVLYENGWFTITTYGVLLAVSYLLGLQLALWRAKARGLNANQVLDLGIYIIIAALIGAKLLLFITQYEYYNSWQDLWSLVRSAGVFYGGLILAVAVAFWYIAKHKMPFWTTCDVFAPGIALGHVTGRLGCFAAGCCYGSETTAPWGVVFTSRLSQVPEKLLGKTLHPVQLYEAGVELLILVLLLVTEKRWRPFPGRTFWSYMFLYAVSRFILENYRGDDAERGLFLGVSTSQWISLVLGPLALGMLLWLSRVVPKTPQDARHRRRATA